MSTSPPQYMVSMATPPMLLESCDQTGAPPSGTNDYVTMITFDNGGIWQKLSPPSSSQCVSHSCSLIPPHPHTPTPPHPHSLSPHLQALPGCSLHLHLEYGRLLTSKYNTTLSKPLSIASAPGIILVHGVCVCMRV